MLAAARLMNQGSGHLFAGAALTRDQHGAVAGADDAKESNTARIRALRPTTMESVAGKGGSMAPSADPQGFELRHRLAERHLEPEVELQLITGQGWCRAGAVPSRIVLRPPLGSPAGDARNFSQCWEIFRSRHIRIPRSEEHYVFPSRYRRCTDLPCLVNRLAPSGKRPEKPA